MSINHEAYLFDPTQFAFLLVGHARSLFQTKLSGWQQTRLAALKLYDTNPQVRHLASSHGGWDRASIIESFFGSTIADVEAIAFYFTVLLYSLLSEPTDAKSMGLGLEWKDSRNSLRLLGWEIGDIDLIFDGKPFIDLVLTSSTANEFSSHETQALRDICLRIRPYSVCGHAGWLGRSDIERLDNELPTAYGIADYRARLVEKIRIMLTTAKAQETGLCVIHSG